MPAASPVPSILHVCQPVDHGAARCVAALAADQVARGWCVTVACPDDGWLPEQVRTIGASHRPWPAVRTPHRGLAGELGSLTRILREVRPDVVHLHSAKAGLTGRLACRARVPVVYQPHAWSFLAVEGPARALALRWERLAARWPKTIVCCSEDEREHGLRAGVRAAYAVVPNAVDLVAFHPPEGDEPLRLRGALGLPAGAPIAVCIGRLSPQKGQDLLVAAWPAVRSRVPEAELVLVGDGPARRELEAAAGNGVRLVGNQAAVRRWLAAADLAVLPSRYEGMALGVLEAMATGRSVVATAADGMSEALGAGVDAAGAIVAIGDVAALAEAIADRLLDPELRAREGARGRARAVARHGQATWCERLADLASDAAGRRRP